MDLDVMSTSELLEAWRDATRAAELAERLAAAALRAVDKADQNAATAEEIAVLAEEAAIYATRAAEAARYVARRASEEAARARTQDLAHADATASETRLVEEDARDRYQDGVAEAHRRHGAG